MFSRLEGGDCVMTIYYHIKRNKYRGDMVIIYDDTAIIYDDYNPFREAVSILNKSKRHDEDKNGLNDVMEGGTFIGPEGKCYKKIEHPLLWFDFTVRRELSGVEPMKSDKSLKELQDLADRFDNDFEIKNKKCIHTK